MLYLILVTEFLWLYISSSVFNIEVNKVLFTQENKIIDFLFIHLLIIILDFLTKEKTKIQTVKTI